MAGIRDDSAGDYGQWLNPQDQSWLDYLGMKAADVGGGAYNALANITGSLSPIGTSEQGNMALQVPPMVSGLYDSAKRIGERGGFTRVEEFDAPLKQDLANALLTFYGGNALSGIAKPRGALGAGARSVDVAADLVREYPETIQLGQLHVDPEFQRQGIATEAQRQLAQQYGKPTVPDVNLSQSELARWQKNDPAAVADYVPYFEGASSFMPAQGSDAYWASQGSGIVPGTRASRGELFSDNKPSIPGAVAATAGEQPKGITAYHGSPHDFDKFSLDKIGTGEGAQAYGHGLYFADSEGVAKSYRDTLSKNSSVTIGGKVINQSSPTADKYLSYYFRDGDPSPQNALINAQSSEAASRANAKTLLDAANDRANKNNRGFLLAQAKLKEQEALSHADGVRRLQEHIQSGDIRGDNPGKMYQVRINADPESFLDWDKPLSQQSEAVRNKLSVPSPDRIAEAERLAKEIDRMNRRIDGGGFGGPHPDEAMRIKDDLVKQYLEIDPSESAWWKFDAKDSVARPEAAAKLREAGIPGIRYLDGNSRGSGAGSSNYVVFDDSLIEILKKYGLAAGAVGAGALAQPDQASAQDVPDWLKF